MSAPEGLDPEDETAGKPRRARMLATEDRVARIATAFANVTCPTAAYPKAWQDLSSEEVKHLLLRDESNEPAFFRYLLPALLTHELLGGRQPFFAWNLLNLLDFREMTPIDPNGARRRVEALSLLQCRVLGDAIEATGAAAAAITVAANLGRDPHLRPLESTIPDWRFHLLRRGLDWVRLNAHNVTSSSAWWDYLHDRVAHGHHLMGLIESAFDGVNPPDEDHRWLHEAECADHAQYLPRGQVVEHRGRWQDLPDQHILECQFALPYLDEQGLLYYLPAYMRLVLRRFNVIDDEGVSAVPTHLDEPSTWDGFGPDAHGHVRHAHALRLFTRPQRLALWQFLRFWVPGLALRAAWLRALEAEENAERTDWLDVLRGAPLL